MTRKKTQQEFEDEVYEIFGDEYTVVGKYLGSSHTIAIRHNKCGNVNDMFPSNVLRGATCIKCSDKLKGLRLRKSQETFEQEVFDLVGKEYSVLGKYKGSSKPIKMRHNLCGWEWSPEASSFLCGNRCPNCDGGVAKSPETFKQEFYNILGSEYDLITPYRGSKKKVKVKHLLCGHEYWVLPDAIINGGERCSKCFGNQRKTTKQFKHEVYDLVGNEYTVISGYKTNKTKITFKHNVCGRTFDMIPTDFLYAGHRCKWCFQHGSSHGNNWIAKSLKENKISYKREYKFDGCKDKRRLPFDFYLPEHSICIEYDGRQHYNKDSKYYSKTQVYHDHLKNQYCKDHGIKLLRMRWDQYPDYASINTFIKQELINNPSN